MEFLLDFVYERDYSFHASLSPGFPGDFLVVTLQSDHLELHVRLLPFGPKVLLVLFLKLVQRWLT